MCDNVTEGATEEAVPPPKAKRWHEIILQSWPKLRPADFDLEIPEGLDDEDDELVDATQLEHESSSRWKNKELNHNRQELSHTETSHRGGRRKPKARGAGKNQLRIGHHTTDVDGIPPLPPPGGADYRRRGRRGNRKNNTRIDSRPGGVATTQRNRPTTTAAAGDETHSNVGTDIKRGPNLFSSSDEETKGKTEETRGIYRETEETRGIYRETEETRGPKTGGAWGPEAGTRGLERETETRRASRETATRRANRETGTRRASRERETRQVSRERETRQASRERETRQASRERETRQASGERERRRDCHKGYWEYGKSLSNEERNSNKDNWERFEHDREERVPRGKEGDGHSEYGDGDGPHGDSPYGDRQYGDGPYRDGPYEDKSWQQEKYIDGDNGSDRSSNKYRQDRRAYHNNDESRGSDGISSWSETWRFSDFMEEESSHGSEFLDRYFEKLASEGQPLYPHQKSGISFLWEKICSSRGCLLADDMGLGKTIQACCLMEVIARFAQLMRFRPLRCLILAPMAVLKQWEEELEKWVPHFSVHSHHGDKRHEEFDWVFDKLGGDWNIVVLTTYQTFERDAEDLSRPLDRRSWDILICDEAHSIKNQATNRHKAVKQIQTEKCILMTGTPVMNALDELWALFSVIDPRILGNFANFKAHFIDTIGSNQLRGASSKHDVQSRIDKLQALIGPYLLRRTKEGVFKVDVESHESLISDSGLSFTSAVEQRLPEKLDVVVWQRLSEVQKEAYELFVEGKELNRLMRSRTLNVLVFIKYLMTLCQHPLLCLPLARQRWRLSSLAPKSAMKKGVTESFSDFNEEKDSERDHLLNKMTHLIYERVDQSNLTQIRKASTKLEALFHMIPSLTAAGHKVLVFSYSTQFLDLIETVVMSCLDNVSYLRLDGTMTMQKRSEVLCAYKQKGSIFNVMLMSTLAGGVGLNLTCADRVILVDPSWNPANDQQAVDRIYRVGQTRRVVIYRMICGGAIEDHMFRIQVVKKGLMRDALERHDLNLIKTNKYFSHDDLKKIFKFVDAEFSETRDLLGEHEKQSLHEKFEEDFGFDFCRLRAVGLSRYDLLFAQLSKSKKGQSPRIDSSQSRNGSTWSDFAETESFPDIPRKGTDTQTLKEGVTHINQGFQDSEPDWDFTDEPEETHTETEVLSKITDDIKNLNSTVCVDETHKLCDERRSNNKKLFADETEGRVCADETVGRVSAEGQPEARQQQQPEAAHTSLSQSVHLGRNKATSQLVDYGDLC